MDPNRRYISRVSTDGLVRGYPDYRSVNPYSGYTAPIYPAYQTLANNNRPAVLVDTTSNYDTHLRSLFYPPRKQSYMYDSMTTEKKKAMKNFEKQDESKAQYSRSSLLAVISFLVIIAAVAVIVAIVYGIKAADVNQKENTTMMVTTTTTTTITTNTTDLLRGTLILNNLLYDDLLKDPNSDLFKLYKDRICNEMIESTKGVIPAAECDIIKMRKGSLIVDWVISLSATHGLSSDELEAKTKSTLAIWLQLSPNFQGSVGPVYKDSCALLSESESPCQQICVNNVHKDDAECKCEDGFELNADGKTCHDVDECLTAGCPDKCHNTDGSYQCVCPAGYKQHDNGKDCIDIDECAINNGDCDQICKNTAGGHNCSCFPGFTQVNNTCLSDCAEGYTQHANGSCIDVDECESSPCDVNCTNTMGSFYCTCAPGTILASDHKQCINGSLTLDPSDQINISHLELISVACILKASYKLTEGITIEWYSPRMEIIENDIAERMSSTCFRRSGYQVCMLRVANITTSDSGSYICAARYKDIPVSYTVLNVNVSDNFCPSGKVYCNNTGICIPDSYLCDDYDDCGDNEDEVNCPCDGFRCQNNFKCISIDRWCNRDIDCSDGSDEMNNCTLFCPDGFVKCNYSFGQCVPVGAVCQPSSMCDGGENNRYCSSCDPGWLIRCNNTGRCITPVSKCNGANDCGDWEDELDCNCFPDSSCPNTGVCVGKDLFCDGNNDCKDGEDERKPCHVNCTSVFTVQCNSTKDCIYINKLCNGENDCGDWEDEKNCGPCFQRSSRDPQIHTHFRCGSGECLHYGLLCDGHENCLDGSDEMNCTGDCPPYFMRCNNTKTRQCIPEDYRCDYYFHCEDGEDESGCGYVNPCPDGEVFCNNTHKCISERYICDGDNDCGDHEDEMDCPCGRSEFRCADNTSCKAYNDWCDGSIDCPDKSDEYDNCTSFCPEGLFHCEKIEHYTCLPPFMLCNGNWDCADGADEKDCECRYSAQIKCNGTYKCIWDTQVCNGVNDCGDLEDEVGCGPCNSTQFKCDEIDVCLSEEKWCDSTKDCPGGSDEPEDCYVCEMRCAPNEMKCDKNCISGAKICDGVLDCSNHEDEIHCNCTDDQFKCTMGLCIDKSQLCDRHIDCPDQSDEANCTKPCGADMFECNQGDHCISMTAVCDGQINCPDASDEKSCGPCNKERDWSIFDVVTITSTEEVRRRMNKIHDVGPFNVSCTMGMCIPAEFWCNGIIDCPDGSDESACKPAADAEAPVVTEWIICPPNYFKCSDNRKCIPPEYVCDLLSDCDDESDESFQCSCPPPSDVLTKIIPPSLFSAAKYEIAGGSGNQQQTPPVNVTDWRRCNATGVCFWSIFLCDGWSVCADGSDESNIGCSDYDLCAEYPGSYTHCDSGECVSKNEICNSEPVCADKSDEKHCTQSSCQGFLCDGGRCVPSVARCNGRRDCVDWTDELNCTCDSNTQYTCPSSTVCVDKVQWCNQVPNCPDSTDESNCTGTCYPEQFFCDGRCIEREHICDGTPNCKDYSDEINCDCSFLTFNCTMGFCLPRDKWCDGIVDCPDGSDEPDHCLRTCPTNFYWCETEQRCIHPFEVCHSSNLSLCSANSTEPKIDCTSMEVSESLCGLPAVSPQDIVPFIFNGDEAMPHSWPWLVALRSHYHGDIIICGGSIIHPEWIVTAAHCVELSSSLDNYKVIIGMHRKDKVEPYQEELEIAQIIMHENWDTYQLLNDIALIKLVKPLIYNRHVRPVCVPKTNFAPGKICTVLGWGDTLGTADENVLQQARLPIINQQTCQYWHRETSNVTSSMICAGYEDGRRGNCYGDSGGPLLCARQGRFWIQGLVTWGKNGCQAEEAPMVFTRIPSFYDWINKHIPLENPDNQSRKK